MDNRNWSRFPNTYKVPSRFSDGRKLSTLQEIEEVIGLVLDGKLEGLDKNSEANRDKLGLLEIIVHRDMPARALDPETGTGIYKLFETQTRLKSIMSAFQEANEKDKLVVSGRGIIAVEKFYIDYLWLEALIRSGLPLSNELSREAITNASQHFSLTYYFLAQKDKLNRPKNPGPAPVNALEALLASAPEFQMPVPQQELVEAIVSRTEDETTRSSLSNDYTRPFHHIPFGAYPSASLKILGDVVNDPWIILNTLSASHGAWAYHEQIKQAARDAIGKSGKAG